MAEVFRYIAGSRVRPANDYSRYLDLLLELFVDYARWGKAPPREDDRDFPAAIERYIAAIQEQRRRIPDIELVVWCGPGHLIRYSSESEGCRIRAYYTDSGHMLTNMRHALQELDDHNEGAQLTGQKVESVPKEDVPPLEFDFYGWRKPI